MSDHGAYFAVTDLGEGRLRVAIKDCIDIAGMPTKAGSAAFDDAPPAACNADVVSAILAADCRIVGKANMHELAYGVTGINRWTGSPVNPLFPDRVPGGSSSGSAVAVAEGSADFAVGTDTGGSIRTPAVCCGIFGLKPTFGRISRAGAWPRVSSLDCIGPLARSMEMIERAMTILAPGYAPRDEFTPRCAVMRPAGTHVQVLDAFDAAVGALFGRPAEEAELPGLEAAYEANIAVIAVETYAAFGHLLPSGRLGADVEARLRSAAAIGAEQLEKAEAVRTGFSRQVDDLLSENDVLLMPAMPCFPLRVADAGQAGAALRMTALVRPFNLSGHPALTVPMVAPGGLPIGVQVIGRRGEDEAVCAVGRMLERSLTVVRYPTGEETNR